MQAKSYRLPELRERQFRKWLDNDEFLTLLQLLEAQALKAEVECVNHRLMSTEFPDYEAKVKTAAATADRYHATVKILQGLRDQKQFETIEVRNT